MKLSNAVVVLGARERQEACPVRVAHRGRGSEQKWSKLRLSSQAPAVSVPAWRCRCPAQRSRPCSSCQPSHPSARSASARAAQPERRPGCLRSPSSPPPCRPCRPNHCGSRRAGNRPATPAVRGTRRPPGLATPTSLGASRPLSSERSTPPPQARGRKRTAVPGSAETMGHGFPPCAPDKHAACQPFSRGFCPRNQGTPCAWLCQPGQFDHGQASKYSR